MNLRIISMIFLTTIVLAACAGTQEQPTPQVPTPSEEPQLPPAPSPPSAQETQQAPAPNASVDALGREDGQLEGVICDPEQNSITFVIENLGERLWNLDQNAPLAGSNEVNVKVFVNNYEANRKSIQFHPETREAMFGPETPFSANCGGEALIAPGTSVQCTLYPIPLNRGSGSVDVRGVNIIRLDSPSTDRTIEFRC